MSVSAFAAPEGRRTSTLAWVRLPGAEGCIGNLELAKAVEERLGRLVFAPVSQADLAVEGRVEPRGAGFAAVLSVSDREGRVLGSRELASPKSDCRSMDRALVFVTSLLIDPDAFSGAMESSSSEGEAQPAPAPVPVVETSTTRASIVPKDERPEPEPEPEAPLWTTLAVSGSLSLGVLPGAAPGAAASFELGFEDGLRGRAVFSIGYGRAETEAGTPASFVLVSGGAALCYARRFQSSASLGACGGAELGALLAQSNGFSEAQDRSSPWYAATLGLQGDWLLGETWLVHVGLELLAPFRRDRFTYQDAAGTSRVLFEPAPIGGRLSVGLGVRI